MMGMPKISVVITCFNYRPAEMVLARQEKTLGDAG